MDFFFSYTFKELPKIAEIETVSKNFPIGHLNWYLLLKLEKNENINCLCLLLFGRPKSRVDESSKFRILADCTAVIKSQVAGKNDFVFEDKDGLFFKNSSNTRDYQGLCIFYKPIEEVALHENHLIINSQITINVFLKIKSITGLPNNPTYSFEDSRFEAADVILQTAEYKLYCHSQILQLHSHVFKKYIKMAQLRRNSDDTKDKLNVNLPFSEDLKKDDVISFLNFLYGSQKTPAVENLEGLLWLAEEFQVSFITSLCEEVLLNQLETINSIEFMLLAWRYNLRNLKLFPLDKFISNTNFNHLYSFKHYEEMKKEDKVSFCEAINKCLFERESKLADSS